MNYVIIPTVSVNGTKQKKKLETIIINSYTYIYRFIIVWIKIIWKPSKIYI